jgi:hypothetical protein
VINKKYTLTIMHHPPTNGNFYVTHKNAIKLEIMHSYNKHRGYTDIRERIMKSFNKITDAEVD